MLVRLCKFVALLKGKAITEGDSMVGALYHGDEFFVERFDEPPRVNDIVLAIADREWRGEGEVGLFYIVKRVVKVEVSLLVVSLSFSTTINQ